MTPTQGFTLLYDPQTARHFAAIDRKYRSMILDGIESQLRYEPDAESRNRKPLERSASVGATWELRLGPHNSFRILYRVDRPERLVLILAIGVKAGNRLFVGGEEIDL